jgi:hypothetical protein
VRDDDKHIRVDIECLHTVHRLAGLRRVAVSRRRVGNSQERSGTRGKVESAFALGLGAEVLRRDRVNGGSENCAWAGVTGVERYGRSELAGVVTGIPTEEEERGGRGTGECYDMSFEMLKFTRCGEKRE